MKSATNAAGKAHGGSDTPADANKESSASVRPPNPRTARYPELIGCYSLMRTGSVWVASAVDAKIAVAASHPKASAKNPVIIQDVCAVSSCLMVSERAMLGPWSETVSGERFARGLRSRQQWGKACAKTVTLVHLTE